MYTRSVAYMYKDAGGINRGFKAQMVTRLTAGPGVASSNPSSVT